MTPQRKRWRESPGRIVVQASGVAILVAAQGGVDRAHGGQAADVFIRKSAVICRTFETAKAMQWADAAGVASLIARGKCYRAAGDAPTLSAEFGPDIVEFRTADNPGVRKFTLVENTFGSNDRTGGRSEANSYAAPIVIGGGAGPACGFSGTIVGLDPNGDGFLSVRSGSAGRRSGEIDRLFNGDEVFLCAKDGPWFGAVYGQSRKLEAQCGVDRPWPLRQPYSGPCRFGWIHFRYVRVQALSPDTRRDGDETQGVTRSIRPRASEAAAADASDVVIACFRATTTVDRIEACSTAVESTRDPKKLEKALLRRGNALMEAGRYQEAAADFNAIIKLNPAIAGYHDNRAHALAQSGRRAEALAEANETVRLAPNYAFGYSTRGNLYLESGLPGLALADYEKGLSVDPSRTGFLVDRGHALAALGRENEAIASYSAAIQADPGSADAYRERGFAYRRIGNRQAAVEDLVVATRLNPSDVEAARGLEDLNRVDAAPSPPQSAKIEPPSSRPPSATEPPEPKAEAKISSGSGFYLNEQGEIATNAHVVDGCHSILVKPSRGAPVSATVAASDAANDLSVLKTSLTPQSVATIRSGVRLGESVAAFGFPLADVLASSGNFTPGAVTALSGLGDDSRYLQISAPVQPGNSGGPLLDQSGTVVGVVSAKLNALKIMLATNGDIPQNVNFAIKSRVLATFLESNRIAFTEGAVGQPLAAPDLADKAIAMSVFILCR